MIVPSMYVTELREFFLYLDGYLHLLHTYTAADLPILAPTMYGYGTRDKETLLKGGKELGYNQALKGKGAHQSHKYQLQINERNLRRMLSHAMPYQCCLENTM